MCDFACSDHARLVEFSRTLVGGAELLIMATCVTAAALILMAGLLSRVHVRKLKRKILDLEQLVEVSHDGVASIDGENSALKLPRNGGREL